MFLWEAKFRRQTNEWEKNKRQKKNKFGELSTKEIQEITDNALSVTTKKPWSSEWEY